MTDDQLQAAIDAALGELAGTKPGPHFVPRLRAHVEQSRRTILPFRRASLALAAVVLSTLALVVGNRAWRDAAPAADVAPDIRAGAGPNRLSPLADDRSTRPAKADSRPVPRARPAGSARSRREPRAPAPEVLVPSDQRGAVGRLFAALNAGQPEAVSMMQSVVTGYGGETALTVVPIRIDPVVVSPMFDK